MKVILTENVKALGSVGDLVSVSQGFGRNFLIPQRKAVMADENNKKVFEDQQRRLKGKIEETLNKAKELATQISGVELEYTKRVASNGKLFGAVSAADIAKSLDEKGHNVEKRQIFIKDAIKAIGTFDVTAKIFKDVSADFKVKVIMDPSQIEEMKKKQEAAAKRAKAKKEAAERGETEEGEAVEGEAAEGEVAEGEATEAEDTAVETSES